MIANAVQTLRHTMPTTPSMVGGKVPVPHRLFLSGGQVLEGDLFRAPSVRLADHLTTLKGFLSLTNAVCRATGSCFPYIVVNLDHVLFIEEVGAEPRPENRERIEPATATRLAGTTFGGL